MQNTSSAVMQRRVEPNGSLDDFPTPPWATRAICERLCLGPEDTVREPAANRGYMVKPLMEFAGAVLASDVFDYGAGFEIRDYLGEPLPAVDYTITNPPFRLAEQFIIKALKESNKGVAVIVRSAFLEGKGRFERLFNMFPPSYVYQFTERVVMHKGKLSANGSTATAYCWIVWDKRLPQSETKFGWIEPCRKRLEKAADYMEAE